MCQKCKHQIISKDLCCSNCDGAVEINEEEIIITKLSKYSGIEFHEEMPQGTTLRQLQKKKLHLAKWETRLYKKTLKKWCKTIKKKQVAMDLGCGDGRFTELLFDAGFQQVIAVDANLNSLKSLEKYAREKGFRDRLTIIRASADEVPIQNEKCDLVMAIGVFYYLNENMEDALASAARMIKPGGILIDSEPDYEGACVKAIVFEGLNDLLKTFQTKTFSEMVNGKKFWFRCFENDEYVEMLEKHRFKVVDSHGLSLFPSLARISLVKGLFSDRELSDSQKKLENLFEEFDLNGKLSKHILRFSRKS